MSPLSKWEIAMGFARAEDMAKPIRMSAETLQKMYPKLPSYQDIIVASAGGSQCIRIF